MRLDNTLHTSVISIAKQNESEYRFSNLRLQRRLVPERDIRASAAVGDPEGEVRRPRLAAAGDGGGGAPAHGAGRCGTGPSAWRHRRLVRHRAGEGRRRGGASRASSQHEAARAALSDRRALLFAAGKVEGAGGAPRVGGEAVEVIGKWKETN